MVEIFAFAGLIWAVLMGLRLIALYAERDEKMEQLKELADEKIRVVKLEPLKEHDTILAYDGENHQFLGQASSVPELKQVIMNRFPTKVFILGDKAFSRLQGNAEVQLEKSITS